MDQWSDVDTSLIKPVSLRMQAGNRRLNDKVRVKKKKQKICSGKSPSIFGQKYKATNFSTFRSLLMKQNVNKTVGDDLKQI